MSSTTKSTTKTRTRTSRAAVLLAAVGTAAVGVATLAGPAEAGPRDVDRPKVTERNHDFGRNWAAGAPVNGGHLEWELSGGRTYVTLSGYHYLARQKCGRVRVKYYDSSHDLLGTDYSALHCAPGNGKTQWFVTEHFSSRTVEHAHVDVVNAQGKLIGGDTADFD
ncbi:hypothetical protein [Nocardioides sp. TF02-7]|uniref:hypothetical protein n=1 Tax=Nocardioides sp. TF02-7 TaxID=2917724 RepID=UPI001F05134C|nr:hypothetical protein [Nocardioides sp. TF02-7]UMG91921.1 hypothetical protein MF408_18135 [Nocardioides sp. TF02-7]